MRIPTSRPTSDGVIFFFERSDTFEQLQHAQAAPAQMTNRDGSPGTARIMLVGDAGVYLMSTGEPRLLLSSADGEKASRVAYATGVNPHQDPFETWWPLHNAVDEGSDFVVDFPTDLVADAINTSEHFIVCEVTEDDVAMWSDREWAARESQKATSP